MWVIPIRFSFDDIKTHLMHFHKSQHSFYHFSFHFVLQFEMFLISIQHSFLGFLLVLILAEETKMREVHFFYLFPLFWYLVWHLHDVHVYRGIRKKTREFISHCQKFIYKWKISSFMEVFKWHQKYDVPTILKIIFFFAINGTVEYR